MKQKIKALAFFYRLIIVIIIIIDSEKYESCRGTNNTLFTAKIAKNNKSIIERVCVSAK